MTPGRELVRRFLFDALGEPPSELTVKCVTEVLRHGFNVSPRTVAEMIEQATGARRIAFETCDAERRRLIGILAVPDDEETRDQAARLVSEAESYLTGGGRSRYEFGVDARRDGGS